MFKRITWLVGAFSTAVLILFSSQYPVSAQAAQDTLIEDIEIRGNRRIPKESILYYVQSKPNDRFDQSLVQSDLQSIIQMGMFDPLATKLYIEDGTRGGKVIIFQVREYPIIRDLQYRGMKSVTESEVLTRFKERRVLVSKESQYDPSKANGARVVIKEMLAEKGHPNAKVGVVREDISATTVALVFNIEEGPRVRVKTIEFVGARDGFSQRRLRGAMKLVKESGFLSSLTSKDIYFKEKLAEDLQRLQFFLSTKGFLQAKIGEPAITDGGKASGGIPLIPGLHKSGPGLKVLIPIEVGRKYKISKVEEKGVTIFQPGIISLYSGMRVGEWVDAKKIQDNIYKGIKDLYGTQGYIQAQVDFVPKFIDKTNDTGEVEVTLEVDEGRQFSLRRLEFIGNTSTRDVVLRREVALNEGDAYNKRLWDYSLLKLNQLGLFDEVKEKDAITRTNDRDQTVDIDLQVKEKGKQQIQLNGGVSGYAGSFFGLEYSTNNFMGYGETLSLAFSGGNRSLSGSFGFTEPYFLGKQISLGVQLFAQRYRFASGYDPTRQFQQNQGTLTDEDNKYLFTQNTQGGTISLSSPMQLLTKKLPGISRFTRLGLSYTISANTVTDPSVNRDPNAVDRIYVPYSQPRIMTSRLAPSIYYNTKNGSMDPTRGTSIYLGGSITGGYLGGSVNLLQPTFEFQRFTPIFRTRTEKPHVLAMRFRADLIRRFGKMSNQIEKVQTQSLAYVNGTPTYDRYFLGGENDIRGYDIRSISPTVPYYSFLTTTNISGQAIVPGTGDKNTVTSFNLSPTAVTALTFDAPAVDSSGGGCRKPVPTGPTTVYFGCYNTPIGGDTQLVYNIEYRIPIISMLSLAAFGDVGTTFNSRKYDDQTLAVPRLPGQDITLYAGLKGYSLGTDKVGDQDVTYVRVDTAGNLVTNQQYDDNKDATYNKVVVFGNTGSKDIISLSSSKVDIFRNMRSSVGLEVRVQMPVINVPFRLIFAYNPYARTDVINDTDLYARPDKRTVMRFSVGRTF